MARKRILFIDGDDGFVQGVSSSLQRSGFESVLTSSSTEGIERARQDRPDLIVVNVELAPTNGWSVCTKLKKDDDLKGIPIVLTSSTSTQDTFEKHKKLKTRADEYLLKPYETTDLIRVAGGLVGMPDLPPEEEDLVVEDESLSSGDFDMSALDEEIPVAGDEPLTGNASDLNGIADSMPETSSELALSAASMHESPAHELADPLASRHTGEDTLSTESLDDLSTALGFESASPPPLPAPEENAVDDLSAFDESFANLAAPESEVASSPSTTGGSAFVDFNDEQLLGSLGEPQEDPLAEDSLAEGGFSSEDLAFDDVPFEVPSEAESPLTGEEGDASLAELSALSAQSDGFGPTDDDLDASLAASLRPAFEDDSARVAGLEARIAELEAEIEGYRATENSRDAELDRLREESAQKERDAEDLRRTIRELKDSESRMNAELTKARDERVRRDAMLRSLTQKAEQFGANALRLERELAAVREDARAVPGLRTRIAELEQAHKEALADVDSVRTQLDATGIEHDKLKAEHAQATSDLDAVRSNAEDARQQAEAARQEAERARQEAEQHRSSLDEVRLQLDQLQQKVAQSKQEADQSRHEADQLRQEAEQARQEALQARQAHEDAQQSAQETQRALDQSRGEAESARQEAEQARKELAQTRQELEQARQTSEETQRSVEASRREADELRAQVTQLQQSGNDAEVQITELREQLATAEESIKNLSSQAAAAGERAARAREALRQAVEHLGSEAA